MVFAGPLIFLNSSRAALVLFNPKTPIQVRLGRQSWPQTPCSLVRLGDDDSTSCAKRKNLFLRGYQLSVTEPGISGLSFLAFVSPADAKAFPRLMFITKWW
jgi:hypothetical protein